MLKKIYLLFFLFVASIIFILVLFSSHFIKPTRTFSIESTPPSLKEIFKINELHVYRMVVSDRMIQNFDSNGRLLQNGKYSLDYVGVCIVDATLPLENIEVDIDIEHKRISLFIPKIIVNEGIIDEAASFTWKNNATNIDNAITKVSDIISKRAVVIAINNGIIEGAEQNATQFFHSFLSALGYKEVVIKFGNNDDILIKYLPFWR